MSPHRLFSVVIATSLALTASLHGVEEELYPGLLQSPDQYKAPATSPAATQPHDASPAARVPTTSLVTAPAAPPAVRVIPPLTPDQSRQLATAADHERGFDAGALYPLLFNAVKWPAGVETGAMIPDFEVIRDAPEAARGQLFLIEGEFITETPPDHLSRSGPWEPAMRRWVVRPDSKRNELLVIFLVNPPPAPRTRQNVRLPARFYMLWTDNDNSGKPRSYPILVGAGARIMGERAGPSFFSSSPLSNVGLLAVAGIVVLIIVKLAVRSAAARRSAMEERREARELRAEEEREAARQAEQQEPPLPDDPIAAMEELKRRRENEQRENLEKMGINPDDFSKPAPPEKRSP